MKIGQENNWKKRQVRKNNVKNEVNEEKKGNKKKWYEVNPKKMGCEADER